METKKKSTLSFGLRYGYGLGEFGLNFLLTYITYYLTFYLTNVAGRAARWDPVVLVLWFML